MAYWITLANGRKCCANTDTKEEAIKAAEERYGSTATEVATIPYPAMPCVANKSGCPTFCYTPDQCKGRSSCPKSTSCSE